MTRLEQHLAGPLRALLGLVLIAMVAINVANATGRYLGFRLPAGLDELLVYMMIWIVMAGAVLALLQREHLAIDLLPQALRPKARSCLVLLGDVVVLAVSITVARQSWTFIERIDRLGQTSMGLGIPMTWPHAAVLAGFGGMTVVALLLILRDVAALRGHDPAEARP